MKKIHSPIAAKPSTRIGRAIAILCARRVLSNRKEVPLLFLVLENLEIPLIDGTYRKVRCSARLVARQLYGLRQKHLKYLSLPRSEVFILHNLYSMSLENFF
jgi:hypothetical protein